MPLPAIRTTPILIAVLAFATGALVTGHAFSQDGKPEHIQKGEAMYADVITKMAAKTPEHEWLAGLVGEYTGTAKVYTSFSPTKPVEYAWTSRTEMLSGGRFARTTISGAFFGLPFEGHGVLGYDTRSKKWTEVSYSNMGTWLETFEGTYDAATKTMTLMGREQSMEMGGAVMKFTPKLVMIYDADDAYTFQRYAIYAGGMEIKEVECRFQKQGDSD